MHHKKSELYFLLFLLAGAFLLAFFVFKPFLYALVVAVVCTTVFKPLHRAILARMPQMVSVAALCAAVSVLVIVVVPIVFLCIQIVQEAAQLYAALVGNGGTSVLLHSAERLLENLQTVSPVPIPVSIDIASSARQGLAWLLSNLGPLVSNAATIAANVLVFLIALYYLFKDGGTLKSALVAVSPLEDVHDEMILRKLELAVNAVVKGKLAVALVQGLLTGVGFALAGIPSSVLWGSVAVVAALIPAIGTALVFIPAVLYLILAGNTFLAIGLGVWGVIAVGLIDNVLGPKLMGRGVALHPFLILLSILGGIAFWGPLGFLLGPLTLSFLFVLLDIYAMVRKEHEGQ